MPLGKSFLVQFRLLDAFRLKHLAVHLEVHSGHLVQVLLNGLEPNRQTPLVQFQAIRDCQRNCFSPRRLSPTLGESLGKLKLNLSPHRVMRARSALRLRPERASIEEFS